MILPVIMTGGSGTRLWPLSRGNYPKQFLSLNGEQTMLQQTIARLKGLDHQPSMLICNEEHRFIAAEQIRQLDVEHSGILLEPEGRNTAPAIALAAFKALENNKNIEEPILLVLAADHVIENKYEFHKSVKHAYVHAQDEKLVTFGILADKPETGYGYVMRGESLESKSEFSHNDLTSFRVSNFVEKPNLAMAQSYVDSGEFYWNSGMFMFKASRYLAVLKQFRPDIYEACKKSMQQQTVDNDFIRINKEAFLACPDESIDYAVMEPICQKIDRAEAIVVPMNAGWNDIGGFSALWQVSEKDNKGNVFNGDVKATDTKNSLVISDDKLVALVGVNDLVIVNTKDAILVAHKDKAQEVKSIVNELKKEKRSEATFHREVYRPWGKYDSLDSGERFQVKRITVKPGAKLSVQMHHHRAEHWVVVSGTAKITNDDNEILLTENQSTYIPIGVVHALENPGVIPLELIEVQSGSYLGEDDIVRFEDKYGRS
ncbi:mannose-1-phosphate guanylyltransferase/mannose-6-phosphate isomerase [Pseudoalteromonas sp. NBT06-2]|uniref:mannose-1-phosphate guanylyltransferase/mannose-6-phosphate isomerase n=1 Tax=Pseudoalteromonas sp. NBT06-2 TaxID=2025950 RepID=UPI000BA643EC|nr:mannose-1-phosphate guanylyltransferase/mannose-6-phosphate isomerase [Pseudoalteromonas sp. NBT06-2]PAJ74744.1 mannose-1-phosphate guanylyltransferase/mannose-6-phosphate isomerase [Pseudoalteromonas sp. NBT06-2]